MVEKFPTSTSVVSAGWNNPTNAYINDGVYTDSLIYSAEQAYTNFGFNFNESDTIEAVFIKTKFWYQISSWLATRTAGYRLAIRNASSELGAYLPFFALAEMDSGITDGAYAEVLFDVSSVVDKTLLNSGDLELRITNWGLDDCLTLWVDFVSVEVAYHKVPEPKGGITRTRTITKRILYTPPEPRPLKFYRYWQHLKIITDMNEAEI